MLSHYDELSRRIDELEESYDKHFKVVFDAIRLLMDGPVQANRKPIGFHTEKGGHHD